MKHSLEITTTNREKSDSCSDKTQNKCYPVRTDSILQHRESIFIQPVESFDEINDEGGLCVSDK